MSIDGKPVTVRPAATIGFTRRDGVWRSGASVPGPGEKRAGAEGPISDAFTSRILFVYGNGGAEVAARAADWSAPRNRLSLSFRMISDAAVTDTGIETSNLFLFGSRETNSLIARFGNELPIELNAGAADYGLLYIKAVGQRYVVVNSGLPWWTGAEYTQRAGYPYMPARVGALMSFPDYVLFKGSLEHIVAEGRFDANWRIPPADAEKMSATGAVRLNQ